MKLKKNKQHYTKYILLKKEAIKLSPPTSFQDYYDNIWKFYLTGKTFKLMHFLMKVNVNTEKPAKTVIVKDQGNFPF